MLRIKARRRELEALEKIARASCRMADAAGRIAESEKEKTGFLKWFVGLFGSAQHSRGQRSARRYGADGGLRLGETIPPVLPIGPSGGKALLPGDRPCINVTDSLQRHARR